MPPRAIQSEVTQKRQLSGWSYRKGRWKMIELARKEGRSRFLFDLHADPREQVDLASQHPQRIEALAKDLAKMLRRGRESAMDFTDAEDLELSGAELDRLRGLGYID